jgi:hypothetical protein
MSDDTYTKSIWEGAKCPQCEYPVKSLKLFDGRNGPPPRVNDAMVCVCCQAFLIFEAGGNLRRLTMQEFKDEPSATRDKLVAAQREVIKIHNKLFREGK